ncbi:hypothetical protein VTJ49DRAFT_4457 [Mycothermus thermophilus]|uniref:C2H2-type domain-containing protein n=1 Tax=Humicola insolens TaxID=85995 RepID=A0ABR3VLB4_HUMIN
MTTFGLEVLLEDLIPEIAYSGEKGVRVVELLKIVRKYHLSVVGKELSTDGWTAADDAELEKSLTEAEMASAKWAWDWLRTQSQILINGDRRWNRLELGEVLALPEAEAVDPEITPTVPVAAEGAEKAKGKKTQTTKKTKDAKGGKGGKGGKSSKAVKVGKVTKDTKDIKWEKLKMTLTTRPRIHPTEDLVWQTLTRHGVDYKKVPALEWACLQGIASARAEGILQSDLRRLVNQDKRSLPKRTDSLAQKGYIAKRTVVVAKMKTSRLWLIDFAPPLVEADNPGLDLTPENLTKDLEPVTWHNRWTGNTIDMDALGRTVVGIVKAWKVIRYADLRAKLGISGKRWQMKTLAKNSQRLVDMGVFRYTAASFPGARKVFKDCLKFVREPTADEWEKFLATGKKTSKYSDHTKQREPKPNALALYRKAGGDGKKSGDTRSKVKRIFSGWTPEKPLAQTVFEVIRSAGPEGASNPQISAATIGYQHRRYLSSYLTKVADTQQPPHLKKFQVASQLIRTGKTSAYMYSAVGLTEPEAPEEDVPPAEGSAAASVTPADRYGFGAVRSRAFAVEEDISLSNMSALARKTKPSSKASKRRLLLPRIREERLVAAQPAGPAPAVAAEKAPEQKHAVGSLKGEKAESGKTSEQPKDVVVDQEGETVDSEPRQSRKRSFGEINHDSENPEDVVAEPPAAPEENASSTPAAADTETVDETEAPEITEVPNATEVSEAPEASTPTEEPKEPDIPELLTPEQLVLNVRYGTIIGKLQVHQSDRRVTFLRSGRGLKKPVIIPIDANLEDPIMQDIPTVDGSEKSLVFTVSGAAGAETSPHVFIYGDEDQHRARWIQREVIRLKDPNAEVPTAGAGAEGGQAAVAGATPAPAGAKGKKTARGGRGKGKKKTVPAGAKPYVCSLCGGAWKNDIGLKYHLEKAQVPCNPNFDPASLLDRPRKRRRLSPPPPPPAPVNPEPADDGIVGRRPRRAKAVVTQKPEKKRRFKRSVRTAIRSFHGPAGPFRGLAATDSQGVEEPEGEAKKRTAQAFDIINYLLDNNLGVFPGERALFYAMTKVFLKEFPNQMPPTWKNFVSAIKAIETRKLATVHTHMVKTEKGRLQTCTLLIRTGVDPNGIIATRMKQKIREVYPAIFIPPAFSPNKEELALLQELDKKATDNNLSKPNANGKKFRSRRKIEEVEVLNAHYYTNTAPAPKRDPLWIREFERNHDGRSARARPINQESLGPVAVLEHGEAGEGGQGHTRQDNGESAAQGSNGEAKNIESVWPDHPQSCFENLEGGLTFDGWMPNQKWLLAQNILSGVEEMAEQGTADKIKPRDWADRNYARFCSIVDQCAAWEQSPAGAVVIESCRAAPGLRFINFSPPALLANNKTANVKWSEDTQYDLETLPYGDLEDDNYNDVLYVEYAPEMIMGINEPFPKRRRMQNGAAASSALPPPLPSQRGRRGGRPSKVKLAAIKTMREHTAYPKSSEDLLWSTDDDLDWSSENVRLAAFIVVTTLLGGVDRVVDWGLMLRLVPDQTISQLRHYWCALKKDRQSTIVSLTDKFRRAFLKAYEKGEVPPIDFNNVLAYDWKFLIKWTTKLDMQEKRTLPATREVLEQTATVTNFRHDNRPWREAFYHAQRSIFNKFQDATCEPLALPVDEDAVITSDPKPDLEMVVAMAWTRSLCVTPVEAYSAEAVLHRRNSLFPHRTKAEITELMVKGVDQLQKQGVISKSSSKWTNGRRWRFNTRVLDWLEKMAQQEKFTKAAEFKRELDRAFRSSETKKHRVTYITNDGMIMALLNLQANGRVRIETTGQPHVPMGHEPGNYETRKYTKKYMHFRLDVVPTERYLYDDADSASGEDPALATLRNTIRSAAPPTRGPGGAVPAWCDVFGKVDAERWLKYLSAVLITLASRGSMPVGELVQTLKPVIMAFEAELILEWLAGLGLMAQQVEGVVPAVGEWWWVVVGVQREGLLGGRE